MLVQLQTPFERYLERWRNGCGALECSGSLKVFFRGRIPCGVLIVGQAPGESEDLLGYPFKGPAGLLQDSLLKRVDILTSGLLEDMGVGFCNIVGCIPREEVANNKETEPSHEQIVTCKPRTEELIELAHPTLVIAAGQMANDYLDSSYLHCIRLPSSVRDVVHVSHPAWILKLTHKQAAKQAIEKQRYVITVANAVKKNFGGKR